MGADGLLRGQGEFADADLQDGAVDVARGRGTQKRDRTGDFGYDLCSPGTTPNSGMTSAASRWACSAGANSGVNNTSSAPAATTSRSWRTQSPGVPAIAAASISGDCRM